MPGTEKLDVRDQISEVSAKTSLNDFLMGRWTISNNPIDCRQGGQEYNNNRKKRKGHFGTTDAMPLQLR